MLTENQMTRIRKETIFFTYLAFVLIATLLLLFKNPEISEADSMYQAGGLSVDLRTDLPYGMEMKQDGGNGVDGTYGGKIYFKLYGTISTINTVSITALTFPTSGMQYALMIHLPNNISSANFKSAYDKAFKDNPKDFYSLSGQNSIRIDFKSTTGMRTFNGSSDDNSPGWKDPNQNYDGIDTEHQLMFCQRGDSVDLSTGKIYDIWNSEPDKNAIKFELHFAIDVDTLMKDGDPNDYTPSKGLTKKRLPVSNTFENGQECNKFKLTADFFGRTYKLNSGLIGDTTNTINYRWVASPEMWLRASSLLSAANGDSDNENHQIVTGISAEVKTWSSYISPWDNGDSSVPLSNYNQKDANDYPEIPGITKMLPGDFLNPTFTINQRQDNPNNWNNDYVRRRFARVINFHTHQIDEGNSISVSSNKIENKTIYSFTGKDGRGIPLVAPPLSELDQPTINTNMTVIKEDYISPTIIETSTVDSSSIFHKNQKIPINFTVSAPTSRSIQIEEKTSGESNYQIIGTQDLRTITEKNGHITFNFTTLPLSRSGDYKLTFRIIDLDNQEKGYSNEKSVNVSIDKTEMKVKKNDSIFQYGYWSPEKEVLSLIDPQGNKGNFNDVKRSFFLLNGQTKTPIDNINTDISGKYEIDYEYLGIKGSTILTIVPSEVHVGAHDGSFTIGTKFDPSLLFDSAINDAGEAIPYNNVRVSYDPKKVDDQHPGVYSITYDISDIVGHKKPHNSTSITVNWTYIYGNKLKFEDVRNADMLFDSFKFDCKSHSQTLSDCKISIFDTTDPKSKSPWKVQVAYDKSDKKTKEWIRSNLSITVNPSSADYVETKTNVIINEDFQQIANLKSNDIDNKKVITKLDLNPTVNTARDTPSNDYQAKILWNLESIP